MPTCLALAPDGLSVASPRYYVGGAEAVLTMALYRLTMIRGDNPEDRNMGLPWLAWAQDPTVTDVEIEGEVRRQLLTTPDLIEVVEVTVARSNGQIKISPVVAVREDDSVTVARIHTAPEDNLPGAWYQVIDPLPGHFIP